MLKDRPCLSSHKYIINFRYTNLLHRSRRVHEKLDRHNILICKNLNLYIVKGRIGDKTIRTWHHNSAKKKNRISPGVKTSQTLWVVYVTVQVVPCKYKTKIDRSTWLLSCLQVDSVRRISRPLQVDAMSFSLFNFF